MDSERIKQVQKLAEKITEELTKKGQLVEGGWAAFRFLYLPTNATEEQLKNARITFFLGAEHIWVSMMCIASPGEPVAELDLKRMMQIHNEFQKFEKELLGNRRGH